MDELEIITNGPKIERPSSPRIRREEMSAHWVLGGTARLTIGTSIVRLMSGEMKKLDLGGLILTIEVPKEG